ncbi:MAG TPA: DMT family transporter, partial [Anaerolineales bacterium]|nr:DMT family transporter [Anaerolineales bacterium]
MPNLTRGYLLALLSAAILSTTAIFIRYLTQTYQMPPLLLAFWRDGIVALCLLPALWLFRPGLLPAGRRNLGFLVAYGLMLAIFNALWTVSVALNGAAIATVMAYCSAAFTALLGWWLLKERLDWAKLLAVAASLAGCVLVSGALDPAAWLLNLIGVLAGLLSGLFYAIYSLMGRAAAQRGLNPWTTLLYTFGFAAGFLFFFNLVPGELLPMGGGQFAAATAGSLANFFWLDGVLAGWAILFLLAAGPTLAGFGIYNMSLGLLPSSVANLVLTLEPAFTAVIAYFLLGEMLTAVQIGGSLLIMAGVAFLRLYEGWLEAQPAVA